MRLIAGDQIDVGRRRHVNQDALYRWVEGSAGLFIVADGVGATSAGGIASQLAIHTIAQSLLPMLARGGSRTWSAAHHGTAATPDADSARPPAHELYLTRLVNYVGTAIGKANRVIRRYGQAHPESLGLGTTVALVAVTGHLAIVGHAGDSRVYRVRDHEIGRLTQDHSLVALLVTQGTISEDAVYAHPYRSGIYKSLGAAPAVYPTITACGLVAGDRLLVCSDGLWGMVEEDLIRVVIRAAPDREPQQSADALVAAANERGGEDNISVIVIHCVAGEMASPDGQGEHVASRDSMNGGA